MSCSFEIYSDYWERTWTKLKALQPYWLKNDESLHEVVLSTRFRLARNLNGLPFPKRANPQSTFQVVKRVRSAVKQEFPHWRCDLVEELSPLMRELFFEMHLVSKQIVEHPRGSMVCLSAEARVAILVNEEDHLRIQLLLPGLQMWGSCRELVNIEQRLANWLDFAFHPQYGYLTSCITNLGTGLRASVMLHVPALSWMGALAPTVARWPDPTVEFRGIFGEGSSMDTSFVQLSNKVTLGADVESICNNVLSSVQSIVSMELASRQEILHRHRVKLEDSVHRSFATLRSSRIMGSLEASNHLSMVRLGACLGLLPHFPVAEVLRILVGIRPAHLQVQAQTMLSPEERDQWRASKIRRQIENFVENNKDG